MCKKEPATVVDKQLVKLGGDFRVLAAKTGDHFRKDVLEVSGPGFSTDLDGAGSDLPDVAYGGVDNCFLAPAIRSLTRVLHHRLDLWARYRERKRADTFDFHSWHRYLHCSGNEEIARAPSIRQDGLKCLQFLVVLDFNVFHDEPPRVLEPLPILDQAPNRFGSRRVWRLCQLVQGRCYLTYAQLLR